MAIVKLTERNWNTLPLKTGTAQSYYWDRELRGFGLVVGATSRTFIVRRRVDGRLTKVKIGVAGAPRDDKHKWSVRLARKAAEQLIGAMADPKAKHRRGRPTTLREGLALHVDRMRSGEGRKKVCSPRSIEVIEREVKRHLAGFLDRPITDITRPVLRKLIAKILRDTPHRRDAHAENPGGRALSNRLLQQVSAIWNTVDDELQEKGGLPMKSPVPRPSVLVPRDTRINEGDFAAWYAKVMAMKNEVRRDLQLVLLFTSVRSEGMRTLTWDEIDFEQELIQVARAKGDRPYTIPMTATLREILERRKRDNAIKFSPHGGDHGFVFPSITRNRPYQVIGIHDAKEREFDVERGVRTRALPGPHALRRTYNSVAMEIGIPLEPREMLLNHSGRGINRRVYGAPQVWDFLRECAERIEAALWERIRGGDKGKGKAKTTASRGELRSVP